MFKTSRDDILNGNITKQFLVFFLPVFLGLICDQLYNTIDAVIVGKYVGKVALAAVGGTTSTTLQLLVNFIWGLTSGVTVIIAQYYGKRDYEGVEKAVKTGMFLALVLGIITTLLGFLVMPSLLNLLNVPSDIYPLSLSYMRIFLCGVTPLMVYNVGSAILRAIGDSKRPLYFLITSALINIVLDNIFVRVFNWGISGAAVATIIAQSTCCVLILYVFKNTSDCYQFEFKNISYDKEILKKALLIGLPAGIQSVIYSVSNLYIQATVNSFGTNTVAGYTAFGKIDGFYWNFDSACGVAVMTIVGQNYGAKKMDRIKETIHKSLLIEFLGTIFISSICYFFAPYLISIFTSDAEVIEIGVSILKYLSYFWCFFIPIEVYASACKACGNTLMPMIFSAAGICGTRILYLMLYPYNGVNGALTCYIISWALTSIVFFIYYLTGKWTRKQV